MKIRTIIFALSSLLATLPSFADTLTCDSPTVSIQGEVRSRYFQMGRRDFEGPLTLTLTGRSGRKLVSQVYVMFGTLQDDARQVFVGRETDNLGRPITLQINSGGPSTLEIGEIVVHFVPRCTFSVTPAHVFPHHPPGGSQH